MWTRRVGSAVAAAALAACGADEPKLGVQRAPIELRPDEALGRQLFLDASLSTPRGQSCSACHAREVGWTGPEEELNRHGAVYEGAIHERFGNRKPPSSGYATLSPRLHLDPKTGDFIGGNFWDGRATGWDLGNPAADQAMGPPLNPVEQNNPDEEAVCREIAASRYAPLFAVVWGKGALDCSPAGAREAYRKFARSVAIYEDSKDMNAFSSRYDAYLRACISAGNDKSACAEGRGAKDALDPEGLMSAEAWEGLGLFVGKNDNDGVLRAGEGANCASCHAVTWREVESVRSQVKGGSAEQRLMPPMFTDFTYDNIGVPKNPDNPFYRMDQVFLVEGGAPKPINPEGAAWIDPGLGGFLATLARNEPSGWRDLPFVPEGMRALTSGELDALAADNRGKHRAPTLRNVDKRPHEGFVKAYFHNGSFKSLEDVVHFYNTRDVLPRCGPSGKAGVDCWPEPEVSENVNQRELGRLGLSAHDEEALVAFLKTLSDGS